MTGRNDETDADRMVAAQYEAYPYPPRDPADEAKRLISGSPSHLLEIEHYVFAGHIERARPFRVLFAGGGTGDGTIMLAQQLEDAGIEAEITYLDLSQASRGVAEARAQARGLNNIRFLTGSLLTPPEDAPFDYIDCCGVLHHLAEPAEGLAALTRVLAPGGGIGLMLYGRLGRTGVYETQALLSMIDGEISAEARVGLARALLGQLPPTNWLIRNPHVGDFKNAGDAGVYDLLLHSRDRAFSVPEIHALAEGEGLHITGFIEPARYDPASYVGEGPLAAKFADLPPPEAAAAAELLAGNLKVHICYLVRANEGRALPDPTDPEVIPVLRDVDGAALAARIASGGALSVDFDGNKLRFVLPPLAPDIVAAIDGKRTCRAIFEHLRRRDKKLGRKAFAEQFAELYRALGGINVLLLRRRPDLRGHHGFATHARLD